MKAVLQLRFICRSIKPTVNSNYIEQKDYDRGSMDSCEINGNTIYFSTGEEINSYHVFPGTCYKPMLERSTLIGERIEDGFRAK